MFVPLTIHNFCFFLLRVFCSLFFYFFIFIFTFLFLNFFPFYFCYFYHNVYLIFVTIISINININLSIFIDLRCKIISNISHSIDRIFHYHRNVGTHWQGHCGAKGRSLEAKNKKSAETDTASLKQPECFSILKPALGPCIFIGIKFMRVLISTPMKLKFYYVIYSTQPFYPML